MDGVLEPKFLQVPGDADVAKVLNLHLDVLIEAPFHIHLRVSKGSS